MPHTADVLIGAQTAANWSGGGTGGLVKTPGGVLYYVYIDGNPYVAFVKSTDNGLTWSSPVTLSTATTCTSLAVWYDRWSGINADLIHAAWAESATDDVHYRTINAASSDALGTETVIFAGTSTLAGGQITLARARGGNVYCRVCIDAGTEGGFFRLPNANVPSGAWDAAKTVDEALATTDQAILVPGWAADTNDMMMFFWDASANEISRKLYDDSANTWGESSIATSMTDTVATTSFPHFAATVDITNSQNLLVAWSAVDTANADLRCWKVTEAAITEVTNVVLNSTDDQGLCGIGIDTLTEKWHVWYTGKSDGSETVSTAVNVYKKISTDAGTTWGAETLVSLAVRSIPGLIVCPRFLLPMGAAIHSVDATQSYARYVGAPSVQPHAVSAIGI